MTCVDMGDCVTLYVDASGHPDWLQPRGRGDSQWHTTGGIILTSEQDLMAREGIEQILSRYIPNETRRDKRPSEYELHLSKMLSNSGIYRRISAEMVKEMISDICRLLGRISPILLAAYR